MIIPNTYLIGVQKAATTSFYNWLSQHPDICAPIGLKDIEFFVRPEYYEEKGIKYLSDRYKKEYLEQKIILQGCVHYVFFENAISRIKELNKDSKLILILRNPIERAISAYHYAKKFNYENLSFYEAFEQEPKRMESKNIRTLSELTYINHSLYFQQIKNVLKYFPKDQLHIIFYEDLETNPQKEMERTFEFLNVNSKFQVDFKVYNNTGKVKNKTFQKIAFGNNPIRNFLVRNILKKVVPENFTKKMRWRVMDFNTVQKKSNYLDEIDEKFKDKLFKLLIKDIEKLEKQLEVSLDHWKG
jgi:hypothetical protein